MNWKSFLFYLPPPFEWHTNIHMYGKIFLHYVPFSLILKMLFSFRLILRLNEQLTYQVKWQREKTQPYELAHENEFTHIYVHVSFGKFTLQLLWHVNVKNSKITISMNCATYCQKITYLHKHILFAFANLIPFTCQWAFFVYFSCFTYLIFIQICT